MKKQTIKLSSSDDYFTDLFKEGAKNPLKKAVELELKEIKNIQWSVQIIL